MDDDLRDLAALLQERAGIDVQIARITGRSARPGDVGEFIASRIFDIELAANPVQAGHDGSFRSGNLDKRTVNVKIYGDAAGGIDISQHECDYYLVLSGSRKSAQQANDHRWRLSAVYLFDGAKLVGELRERKVAIGTATSLRLSDLEYARITRWKVHNRCCPSATSSG